MEFYYTCATVYATIQLPENTASLRSLCYSSVSKVPQNQAKSVYRVVVETGKYKESIVSIIKKSQLLKTEKLPPMSNRSKSNRGPSTSQINKLSDYRPEDLLHILLYQLLFSRKDDKVLIENLRGLKEGNKWFALFQRNITRLKAELTREKIRRGVTTSAALANEDGISDESLANPSRYVRLNTLLSSSPPTALKLEPCLYVSNVYTIPTTFPLTSHPSYKSGEIIIQDLGSCMPVQALFPDGCNSLTGEVIDCCAAPGNKTSQLSAALGNKNKIFAFERDSKRFEVLQKMCNKAGSTNIEFRNQDFLTVEHGSYSNVTHILCDPSCSGSGMVNQHVCSSIDDLPKDPARLKSLSNFQLQLLSHALRFPSVKRVTYSTCSIWSEEDESVVHRVLSKPDIQELGWKLARRDTVLPGWERRGDVQELMRLGLEEDDAQIWSEGMIRVDPFRDGAAGFFLACFERNTDENAGSKKRKRGDATRMKEGLCLPKGNEDTTEQMRKEKKKKKNKRHAIDHS